MSGTALTLPRYIVTAVPNDLGPASATVTYELLGGPLTITISTHVRNADLGRIYLEHIADALNTVEALGTRPAR